jgi:2-iminobutanoate/2-iminopropanoate deaminase
MSKAKQIINTPNAPIPIGPYSQGVKFGNMLFLSGQIAIEPSTGELIQGSLKEETQQIMKNIYEVLHFAGLSMDSIIKTSIFLTDMAYFNEVNEIYAQHFSGNYPARETVQVSGLPKGVRVEISVIAGSE